MNVRSTSMPLFLRSLYVSFVVEFGFRENVVIVDLLEATHTLYKTPSEMESHREIYLSVDIAHISFFPTFLP